MSNKADTKSKKQKTKRPLTPRLRFPEFLEAGEWEEKKLGHSSICKVFSGATPSKEKASYWNGNIPWISSRYISDEHSITHFDLITKAGLENSSCRIAPKNSTIIVSRVSVGKYAFADGDYAINQDLTALVPIKIYEKFLFFLAENLAVKIKQSATGTGVVGVTQNFIKDMILYLPDSGEQQKIADCLSSIDEAITAETHKLDALKSHKKGLMQQLFPAEGETVPQLRFPEFRDAGEWEVKTLERLADNLDNKRVPITERDRIKGSIPYYGASGVVDYVDSFLFDEELLCISEDGANLIARTSPIAFSISGKSWVNNHAHVLKFEYKATQILVENYLNSVKLDDYLIGMAQPKLNKAMLDSIPIPLPTKRSEQQKIADCLSSLDDLIAAQSQKVEALKTHKKGLMQQLFPVPEEGQP